MSPAEQPPRIVLTGGIASGKSTAATVLAELGAVIVDADLLAREVVAPGSAGLAAVVERFGPAVLATDGSLDRAALAEVVFADAAARADLEAVVHPRVRALAAERTAAAPTGAVVVQVVPLLVETGRAGDFDEVLVVDVDPASQRARLRQRDGHDEAAARARVEAQAERTDRLAVADVVWSNDGDPAALRRQVEHWWRQRGH